MESITPNDSFQNINTRINIDDYCKDCNFSRDRKLAKWVCRRCKCLLCESCVLEKHMVHSTEVEKIVSFVEKNESEYFKMYIDLHNCLLSEVNEKFNDSENPYRNLIRDFERDEKKLNENFDFIINRLQTLREERKNFAEEINHILHKKQDLFLKVFDDIRRDLLNKIKYIEFLSNDKMKNDTLNQRAKDILDEKFKPDLDFFQERFNDENVKHNKSSSLPLISHIKEANKKINIENVLEQIDDLVKITLKNSSVGLSYFKEKLPENEKLPQKFQNSIPTNTNRKTLKCNEDHSRFNDKNNDFTLFDTQEDGKDEWTEIQNNGISQKKNQKDSSEVTDSKNNLMDVEEDQIKKSMQNDNKDSKIPKNGNIPNLKNEQFSFECENESNLSFNQIPNQSKIPKPNLQSGGDDYSSKIPRSNNIYYIGIKSRPNNELIVYNSLNSSLKTLKIDENSYEEKGINKSNNFPYENSKYVNIGNGVIVTGGNYNKQNTDAVFRVAITTNPDNTEKVLISKYTNMISKRERHNILFLEDRNSVIVCSGFYIKQCEISNLNDKKWKKLPDLIESRGNATMFYVNNRYVYIMGGFKVNDSSGEYLNSIEFIDIVSLTAWNYVKLDSIEQGINIKISAMGSLELFPNKYILVGGYDGASYLKNGYELTFDKDGAITSVEKKDNVLQRGSIFFSNGMFMRLNEYFYFNFELQAKGIWYDVSKNEFSFLNPSS